MRKSGPQTLTQRARWAGALVLAALLAAAAVYFPRGAHGPGSVARDFLETLIQSPDDAARLRAAARLGEDENPAALIDGLTTRLALDFLRVRESQGIDEKIRVVKRNRLAAGRYAVTLEVVERTDGDNPSSRRFLVDLTKTDNDVWRVSAVHVATD